MEEMIDLIPDCDQTTLLFIQDGMLGVAQCYLERFDTYLPPSESLFLNWDQIHETFLKCLSPHSPFITMYQCVQWVKDFVWVRQVNHSVTSLFLFMSRFENLEYSKVRLMLHKDITNLFATLMNLYYHQELNLSMIQQLTFILDLNFEVPYEYPFQKDWTITQTKELLNELTFINDFQLFSKKIFEFFGFHIFARVTKGLSQDEDVIVSDDILKIIISRDGFKRFDSVLTDNEIIKFFDRQVWLKSGNPILGAIPNFIQIKNHTTNEVINFKDYLRMHEIPNLSKVISKLESDFREVTPQLFYQQFKIRMPRVFYEILWKITSNF